MHPSDLPRHVVGRATDSVAGQMLLVVSDLQGWVACLPLEEAVEDVWYGTPYRVATPHAGDERLRVFSDGESVTLTCASDAWPGQVLEGLPVLDRGIDPNAVLRRSGRAALRAVPSP